MKGKKRLLAMLFAIALMFSELGSSVAQAAGSTGAESTADGVDEEAVIVNAADEEMVSVDVADEVVEPIMEEADKTVKDLPTVNEAEVTKRIMELAQKFGINDGNLNEGTGVCFTDTGNACSHGIYDADGYFASCDHCNVTNIVKNSAWFANLFGYNITNEGWLPPHAGVEGETRTRGWNCCGFANFALWYIAKDSSTSDVYRDTLGSTGQAFNRATLDSSGIKIGDVICVGNTKWGSIHSAVFIDFVDNGVKVLDCNYVGAGKIAIHTLTYASYPLVSITRARNYVPDGSVYTEEPPIPQGFYQIITGVDESMALDVAGDPYTAQNGANVEISHNTGGEHDVYAVLPTGDGYYKIRHRASGRYVEVDAGLSEAGTNIQIWDNNDKDWQIWKISSLGDGWYTIQSKQSGLYMDVVNSGTEDKTNVQQCWEDGAAAQKWKIVPYKGKEVATGAGQTIPDGDYHIATAYSGEMVFSVDVAENDIVDGSKIQISHGLENEDALFTVTYLENGFYKIIHKASGKAVEVCAYQDIGLNEGETLQLVDYNGGTNQQWSLCVGSDNAYYIQSRYCNFMATVSDALSTEDGGSVHTWYDLHGDYQQWKFICQEAPSVPVTDIKLNMATVTVSKGASVTLTATVTPDNATDKTVKWSSSDEKVATVDDKGVVKAIAAGECTITAEAADGSGVKATCKVTVPKAENSQKDPTPVVTDQNTLVAKQKVNMAAYFGKSYAKYTVDNKSYASVNGKGILTAKKAGKIIVTACNKEGKQWIPAETVELTIEKPILKEKTITQTKPAVTFSGSENLLGVTVAPTAWTSSKPTVALVDAKTGKITTVGRGSTKITAIYGDGKQAAKYTFTVKVSIPVLSKKSAAMQTGAVLGLKLKNTKLPVEWSSSNEKVVTVENGKVTARAFGTATITATVDGVDYTCDITVTAPALKQQTLVLNTGKTSKLGWRNTKLKVDSITWTSSNPGVAVVDKTGKVIAISGGTAVITSEAGGVTGTCTVIVNN